MNWQGIRCLTKFVFGSEITGSGSSSGESVCPDLEVVDPAIKTRELPVGIKARQSAVRVLLVMMRGDKEPESYFV